ncbi:MAG: Crp/Fnr family transcriptional regulator [Granulosicoccaceae bacterium]
MAVAEQQITQFFPQLSQNVELLKWLAANARQATVPAGTTVCTEGDSCQALALVLEGSVRVYKGSENGREITLYRVESSSSCILTASCILRATEFPATAVTETDVEALFLEAGQVRYMANHNQHWRNYLFELVSDRLASVICLVEEVTFQRMDKRLISLMESKHENGTVTATHQQMADELGTHREVVSRLLKDMQSAGEIEVSRGKVKLLSHHR